MLRYNRALLSLALALSLAGCGRQEIEKIGKVAATVSSPKECAKDFRFVSVSQDLGRAEQQIHLGDFRRANLALRDGLEALGTADFDHDTVVLDDTGQRLAMASSEEWNGNLQTAASIRQSTLLERLASYAERENLQRCPTPAASLTIELPLRSS